MDKDKLEKYKEKLKVDMEGKQNSFTFPTVAKIAAYAVTLPYGKEKRRWTFENERPLVCLCRQPVHFAATSAVNSHIHTFAYPYISCHFKAKTYENRRPRCCPFYVNFSKVV
jgi:hypothetical protein